MEGATWRVGGWRMHLRYLWYVLVHKWWVLWWGLHLGVPLRTLIVHDMSKFSREEWGPYARWSYTTAPDGRSWHDVYKEMRANHPGDASEPYWSARFLKGDFDQAWSHHWIVNDHHWEYHAPPGYPPQMMPDRCVREMVADWYGTGYAKGDRDIRGWWNDHKHEMRLHANTRVAVELIFESQT